MWSVIVVDGRRQRDVTVDDETWLAERFEAHRARLRAVAYRMLGSRSEADDALQESWLRVSRADTSGVENLGGWLTTVVGRVCLDMLRSRRARREDPLDLTELDALVAHDGEVDPEQEALLADSVGLALMVLLDTLTPAERLVYVLHDLFAMPYDEIAPIVGRTATTARKLASRARRRIQAAPSAPDTDPRGQRAAVAAFLAASREGDFDRLVALLAPDVVARADAAAAGTPREVRGASAVAGQALAFSRYARSAQLALVNSTVGIVVAPHGRPTTVLAFTVRYGRIVEIDIVADPTRLDRLGLAALD
jgi:RNA polymerase sigma-70 factor (ECF subfamily)